MLAQCFFFRCVHRAQTTPRTPEFYPELCLSFVCLFPFPAARSAICLYPAWLLNSSYMFSLYLFFQRFFFFLFLSIFSFIFSASLIPCPTDHKRGWAQDQPAVGDEYNDNNNHSIPAMDVGSNPVRCRIVCFLTRCLSAPRTYL